MRRLWVPLLLPLGVVTAVIVVVIALVWSNAFRRWTVESLAARVRREAAMAASALPWDAVGQPFDRLCETRARDLGVRITVIGEDGRVLCESDRSSGALEAREQGPEIAEARAQGSGTATRFSESFGTEGLYVAVADRRGHDSRFVRLVLPVPAFGSVRALAGGTIAYGLLAALLVGSGSALLFSRRTRARVREIEDASRRILSDTSGDTLGAGTEDELSALERHFGDLAREMHTRLVRTDSERERLEAVLRGMIDGVVVLDGEGRIRVCNRSAIEQLELPIDDEPVGEKLSLVCRIPQVNALVEQAMRSAGQVREREVTFPGREANRVLSASAVAVAKEGRPLGGVLVLHDLTRMRQFEAMRADFVANVSHELRTPLTAIRGYAETLRNGALRDPRRAAEFVGVIQRHSERLTRLIDDLLTLSDLELGKTEIRPRAIGVTEVVQAPLEMLRQKAEERGIDLHAEVAEGIPPIYGDRDRLEQVLINLIDNAIKYSGPGSRVRVAATRTTALDGRSAVEIAVCDNGVGIPEKEIPRLTERFYRVDRARSRELGGTGLGLAIVKHIVQAHGGALAIESEVGHGTTVHIVLPQAGGFGVAQLS